MRFSTLVATTLSLASSIAYGQVYSPDLTFGTAGKALITFPTTSPNDAVRGLELQGDGRIVVTGRTGDMFGVARLTAQGQPDASFGTAGQFSHSFSLPAGSPVASIRYVEPTSTILQTDGKLVVGGEMRTSGPVHPVTARYLASGTLDPSFGIDGRYVPYVSSGSLGIATASINQQPDGNIISVGTRYGLSSAYYPEISRLSSSGTPDNTYSHSYPAVGNQTTPNSANSDKRVAVSAVDASGRLITAGVHYISTQNYVGPQGAAILRYQSNGQYDPSFGTNGIAVLTRPNGGRGLEWKKMQLQPDGKIVVASLQSYYEGNRLISDSIGVARYLANGTLDPGFGRGGLSKFAFGGTNGQSLVGFELTALGEFVVGARTAAGLSIVRLSSTGQPVLNSMGSVLLPNINAEYMVVQADGKILVAGTHTDLVGTKSFGVVRLTSSVQLSNRSSRFDNAHLQLFPNPATRNITLRLAGAPEHAALQLDIIDALGREVLTMHSVRMVGNELQLPLNKIRPGSYLLRLQGNGFILTQKFTQVD
ncbi:T9SS type A sorting domain-containing protein [Hymenobacter sp. BT190]|uniref:T9SS type A sorting domain-containing protein n=1 Tax=Hymenobacter sp. BT190 TaxID=2763505 RepID=UPI001650D514|nr:T9SS type A sorting domain-containing protein [Hymenobacter sp. BT190]MBC6699659.1 T9SS type A sorting domain-containing protein [Hymenobacter sp. BT190]